MFSWIRRRATYANVVMTLALVFAMTGGAYAAKKYLITSTKQISPSVLKQLVGKTGPAGSSGKDGAPGAQGAQGPQGPAGANGKDGVNGANGQDGAAGAKGATGPQGPAGAKGANGTNGTNGTTGPAGSPWTAGGTLPAGSTETGGWAMGNSNSKAFGLVRTAISFTIPLEAPLAEENVQSNPVGFPAGATSEQIEHCPGSVAEPKAKSGFLCLYTGMWLGALNAVAPLPLVFKLSPKVSGVGGEEVPGTDTSGAAIVAVSEIENFAAEGTWAVTG